MSGFSLSEIDFNEAGDWPIAVKLASGLIVLLTMLGLTYYFFITDINASIEAESTKEAQQMIELTVKHVKSVNLDIYKGQIDEMEGMLSVMLRQLPRTNEVPDLLVDISRAGIVAGLEFQSFKPSAEQPVDFYAELPIQIRVAGSFHQLGKFIESISALSRIVTLHDFSILNKDEDKPGQDMIMNITAKTYRYFDKKVDHE